MPSRVSLRFLPWTVDYRIRRSGPYGTPGLLALSIQDDKDERMNGRKSRRGNYLQNDPRGRTWVDYKNVDELRRLMTPNGKIYSRKRLGTNSNDQRKVAKAIKRARFMALLPYTDGTL